MSLIERLTEKVNAVEPLMIGDSQLTFDSGEDLDEYQLAKAERELRETPEVVQEAFKVLCDLLGEEDDLYVPLEMEFLQKFLRRCKWYPKSAFKLIKRFYEYQQNHPEYFENLVPTKERSCLLSGCILPLPRRTAEGCRIVVIEAGATWNPKEVTLNQLFRGVIVCLEVAIAEPISQVSGVRVIIDMKGLSLSQVTYFSPKFASAIVDFVQRSLPCRLKGVHIINQSFVFDMVFAFFKPFLKGKLRDRIYFHGNDRSSILAYFDAKCLPKKYGGEYDSETTNVGEKLYKFSSSFDDYFAEIRKYGYTKNT
ncbi:alpha-tocopherol transfer protein-like [Copidosoma floridanum]|uniref:alpha-tocopherol transfer protein-like n=1 Tax=Copidosoma floridanum TaxID=29053 RepID=UPI0006C9AB84|nr:alpha-tocopherol transfer protein-like [Copidosoma floridanum]